VDFQYLELLTKRALIEKIIRLEESRSWRWTKYFRIIKRYGKNFIEILKNSDKKIDLQNCIIIYAPVSLNYGSLTGIQRVLKNFCSQLNSQNLNYYFLIKKNGKLYFRKIKYHRLIHNSKNSLYSKNLRNFLFRNFVNCKSKII